MSNWIKSTKCNWDKDQCVEVNYDEQDGLIYVRSNDDTDLSVCFTKPEWDAFVSGVKDNQFDFNKLTAG